MELSFFTRDLHFSLTQTYLILLVGSAVLAKAITYISLKGSQLYLRRKVPNFNQQINIPKLFSPWFYIFTFAFLLLKVLNYLVPNPKSMLAITFLRILTLYCGVMVGTRIISLSNIVFRKYFDY